jgi:hypothetical protein
VLRLLIYSQLKPVYEQICDIIQDRLEGLKENWRNDLQAGLLCVEKIQGIPTSRQAI